MKIKLQPMDMFHTRNPAFLGRGINFIATIWSRDGKSEFSHSGFLQDTKGKTFEAVWTLCERNLFDEYEGEKVYIVRWVGIERLGIPGYLPPVFEAAVEQLKKDHEGQWYPFWRLPLHMFPPAAKYVSYKGRWIVCSETVAKMLYLYHKELLARWYPAIDVDGTCWPRHRQYTGTNPDTLADEGHRWTEGYRKVFKGILRREYFNLEG